MRSLFYAFVHHSIITHNPTTTLVLKYIKSFFFKWLPNKHEHCEGFLVYTNWQLLINRSIQQLHGWINKCNAKMDKAMGKRIANPR